MLAQGDPLPDWLLNKLTPALAGTVVTIGAVLWRYGNLHVRERIEDLHGGIKRRDEIIDRLLDTNAAQAKALARYTHEDDV